MVGIVAAIDRLSGRSQTGFHNIVELISGLFAYCLLTLLNTPGASGQRKFRPFSPPPPVTHLLRRQWALLVSLEHYNNWCSRQDNLLVAGESDDQSHQVGEYLYLSLIGRVLVWRPDKWTTEIKFGGGGAEQVNGKSIRLDDFFPESYRIDVQSDRQLFFDTFRDGQIWICKPSNLQEGRGIFLLKSREDLAVFHAKLKSVEENPMFKPSHYNSIIHRVVQRYIVKPLLLEGRKFDVRSYFLIACTAPFVAFFHHGYAKSTCNIYDPFSDDLTSHLTNQFMQRKNPLYNEMKEETIWSMEQLNDYINKRYMKERHLPKDWVFTVFARRMQEIMTICFNIAKSKLDSKLGYFDLLGCDFIVDQNFKVWLLEMNANPSLHRHCSALKAIIPQLVYEALDVVIEIFKKRSKGAYALPLQSLKEFVLIYNDCHQDQIPRPIRVGGTSPTIKQPSQLCPHTLKRPVRKSLRKPSAIRSLSDQVAVEMKPLQKAVSLLTHGQLPVIAQIQSLYCAESKAKTNPFSRNQTASLEGWNQLQTNVSKPLMMTTPFVSGLNKRFAVIHQQSKSMESSLLSK
ncbi:protein polyglycylase TTLL10-like [Carcharodon carcharias]|uniref:protein polyglycylase TTLL10-like n=1 Tax=Carcharodon carcharias TaxID=13397 RepID=UPI001B7E0583|nr:protein polyglycylase TTLL10-like [Carcharodon carcharias]